MSKKYTKDEYFAIASACDIYVDNPAFCLAEEMSDSPPGSLYDIFHYRIPQEIDLESPCLDEDWQDEAYITLQYCIEKAGLA